MFRLGVVQGRRLGHPGDGVLGGDVERPAGVAVQPEDRGRVHDGPAAGLEHLLDLVLHAVEHALDVHVEQERRLVDVLLVQRHLLAVHPGVVEGHVQATELRDGPLDQGLHVLGLAHVGLLEDGPAPGLLDNPVAPFSPVVLRGSVLGCRLAKLTQ